MQAAAAAAARSYAIFISIDFFLCIEILKGDKSVWILFEFRMWLA